MQVIFSVMAYFILGEKGVQKGFREDFKFIMFNEKLMHNY
jgi:hypothetical protein